MSITHRILGKDVHLLKPNQPLNGHWARALELKFQDIHHQGAKRVIVDLSGAAFVDSVGLAALVKGYRLFGSYNHCFLLAAPQDQPRLLLELTMFDRIFQVYDSVEQAMEPHPAGKLDLRRLMPSLSPQPV